MSTSKEGLRYLGGTLGVGALAGVTVTLVAVLVLGLGRALARSLYIGLAVAYAAGARPGLLSALGVMMGGVCGDSFRTQNDTPRPH